MLLYDKALQYAEDVVSGKEITTKEVQQQCIMFLTDLERQYEDDYKFYLDMKKLKIINSLLSLMNFATGLGTQGKTVLEGIANFQAFFLVNVFGWRYKENPNKFKNRDIYFFVTRKNAKTFLTALVIIILMFTEDNFSEFYSICLNRDLAGEVKKAMTQIISASPLIEKYFKVYLGLAGKVECSLTNSFYQPRTARANGNNAIRPACFIADEVGAFTDYGNISAMKSGQLSVMNPLRIFITTAYAEDNSIFIKELDYIKSVYAGTIKNERMFALLYYSDEENLWNDKGLYMANPLRIEENYEEIRANREKAKVNKGEEAEYLTKNMNHFVPSIAVESFIDIDDLKKCRIAPEDFDWTGRRVFGGLDLSMSQDNTSFVIATEEDNEIYVKAWTFIPQGRLQMKSVKEKVDYRYFVQQGTCFAVGDLTIDYSFIQDFILNIENELGVELIMVGYDNRFAPALISNLEKEGVVCVDVRQHSCVLGSVIQLLEDSIINKTFHYEEDNKLLEINMVNAKVSYDNQLMKWINKKKSNGKIDILMAMLNALYLVQLEMIQDNDFGAYII